MTFHRWFKGSSGQRPLRRCRVLIDVAPEVLEPRSLPSTIAETPRRPCDAITIKSHPLALAMSMIAL